MLEYDEMLLMQHLEPLDRHAKTAFAAACAERMLPLSDRCVRQVGDSLREQRLATIVVAAWQAASGNDVDATALEAEAEALVPDEDDEGWTASAGYAGNAAAAACYALRTWLTNDPQQAAWAAQKIFEAADLAYFQAILAVALARRLRRRHPWNPRSYSRLFPPSNGILRPSGAPGLCPNCARGPRRKGRNG